MNRLFILAFLYFFSLQIQSAELPDGFVEELLVENLDPVSMAMAPDGRIFIAEKNGRILIVRNGELLHHPFLTLEVDNFNERGISGIVFHPDFESNNYFYVYYTVAGANHNRISRFTANGDFAIPGSEEVLLDLDQLSGTIHNGGAMKFGGDGKLYIAVGDGADPNAAQSMNSFHGKILRLNDDGSIPEDNPFYESVAGNRRAIYALGFRNPFTFDIQPGTGRIFVADVGGSDFEEINDILPGGNYGWPLIEGYRTDQSAPENYVDPVFAYSHDIGCAVIGTAFYSPDNPNFPSEYEDMFFFGDYCGGYVKLMDPATGEVTGTFIEGIDRPISFLVGPDGSFYYLERAGMGGGSVGDNTSTTNGRLWQVTYTGSGAPFISQHPNNVLVVEGENARFEVRALGEEPLAYQWFKNGNPISGANSSSVTLESVTLADDGAEFVCEVSNILGPVYSDPATLTVSDGTRPVPDIEFPVAGGSYQAGDTLFFAGGATDNEDGTLPLDQLTWIIDFHHDDHTHPGLAPVSGIDSGYYVIPRVGEISTNVWYRVYLSATDSEGLSATSFVDVHPEIVNITVNSIPSGLRVNIDGQNVTTPHTYQSVIGVLRTVQVPITQYFNDLLYAFDGFPGENNELVNLYSLYAPTSDTIINTSFDVVNLGSGTGITGFYHRFENQELVQPPLFQRINQNIDFNWGSGSPAEDALGNDNYGVSWRGTIEPLFTETYTFRTVTDDGVRLWINDQLIIDQWIDQAATSWEGEIALEAGQRYNIRLDYYERGGEAVCQLYWSSPRNPEEIIPIRQLYPEIIASVDENLEGNIVIYPNPARDVIFVSKHTLKEQSSDYQLSVFSSAGKLLIKATIFYSPQEEITLDIGMLPPGQYILQLQSENENYKSRFVRD